MEHRINYINNKEKVNDITYKSELTPPFWIVYAEFNKPKGRGLIPACRQAGADADTQ